MTRKLIMLLLAFCMLMSLAACSSNEIQGSGTEEDPWLCGATEDDDISVYVMGSSLNVSGSGKMMDFNDAEDRPWNDIIIDISDINIYDGVEYVGKNAFRGAAKHCECLYGYISDELKAIGESAFEGANFQIDDKNFEYPAQLNMPRQLESIGSRAFAKTDLTDIFFYSTPEIADDAFEGVKAKVRVVNGIGWDDTNELNYGGELEYKLLYTFDYEEDYGTEDIHSIGTIYIPEDEAMSYDAAPYADEGYHFVRYEVLEGGLELADPENPVIDTVLTGNVKVKIVYEAD